MRSNQHLALQSVPWFSPTRELSELFAKLRHFLEHAQLLRQALSLCYYLLCSRNIGCSQTQKYIDDDIKIYMMIYRKMIYCIPGILGALMLFLPCCYNHPHKEHKWFFSSCGTWVCPVLISQGIWKRAPNLENSAPATIASLTLRGLGLG